MVGNIFKALSRIALVSLASLVGCVDVDDAPELGETADSVTALRCNQFGWGQVCSRTNDELNFVGIFNNNSGGENTVQISILRCHPEEQTVKESEWQPVSYGDSYKLIYYGAIRDSYYKACVTLRTDRIGCTGCSKVE